MTGSFKSLAGVLVMSIETLTVLSASGQDRNGNTSIVDGVRVARPSVGCFPSSPVVPVMGQNGRGFPAAYMRPRMLSVIAGDPGRNQAIRVTWLAPMVPGWESWEGQSLFAGPPLCTTEAGIPPWPEPIPCGPGTLQLSELQCTPYFTDWFSLGEVNLIHEALAPSKLLTPAGPVETVASYAVQVVDDVCSTIPEQNYSPAVVIRTSGWGDPVGPGPGGSIAVSEDVVNVIDTLNMQAKFTGQPGSASKASMDLLGVTTGPVPQLDLKISVNDLVAVLGAFSGDNYPFVEGSVNPPPGPCPP